MAAGLHTALASVALSSSLLPTPPSSQAIEGLAPETTVFEAVHPPGKTWRATGDAFSQKESAVPREQSQEVLWKQFFADTTVWWDNRRSKPTPRHPDFRHKVSKAPLWLNNRYKPVWVDSQLAAIEAGVDTNAGASCTLLHGSGNVAATEGHLEVELCRRLCEDGQVSAAADALNLLVQRGRHVPNNLFYRVLKLCIRDKDLALGRQIHALSVRSGYEGDAFLATHLIGLYASQGRLEEAVGVFIKVPTPDFYNWATIIAAYARHGGAAEAAEAIRLYRQMCESTNLKADNRLHSAVLKACATAKDLGAGKDVHAHVLASPVKADRFVESGLVSMYAKCGSLEDARRLFDKLLDKDVVTWTTMISGYAQQGMGHEALSLYSGMKRAGLAPDYYTYVSLLQACASVGSGGLCEGRLLHTQIKEQGLQEGGALGVSLIDMYAKCCSLEDARRVFEELPDRNVVAWNALIAGYAQQGMNQEALGLYRRMHQDGLTPDSATYVGLLLACASVGVAAIEDGKQLHAQIKERGPQEELALSGSLVNMHTKCGNMEDARIVFERLPQRTLVAWNAMVAGYVRQGMAQEALCLYSLMCEEGLAPNFVTYVSLLHACAIVAALPLGEHLHAEIEKRGWQADTIMGAALVNMYAKCGSMCDSQRVFYSMPEKSIEAWGALVSGYARQGDSQSVFDLLDRMKSESVHPNGVTFLSVLTVCSHVGLVDKGRAYFKAMTTDYGISATMDHFICMVDLLGRAGHLEEALQMAKSMPFPPNDVVWRTLLGACRKWKNVEIGQQAFEGAVGVDEKDAASYVLMSNIYASTHMWEAAKELRARREKLGVWKKPGQSWWTDTGGVVHTFHAGDKKHPESEGSYERLEKLIPKLKKAGYVPHLESSLLDIPDDEKQAELCGHSEKLAIAYALNKTAKGTTIRIVKNLRVCEDCHTAVAYISIVEKRTIICRDASRFHVYKEGKCSCGDYW